VSKTIRGLLDSDQVLGDFCEHLLEEFPLELPRNPSWDIIKLYPKKERGAVYARLSDPEWWDSMPVVDGAKGGVEYLHMLGHDLHVITSPWPSCPDWAEVRKRWLKRHFGFEEDEVTIAKDKSEEPGDYIIDDRPKNVVGWHLKHPDGTAYLYDTPYNQNVTWSPRFTWARVRDIL